MICLVDSAGGFYPDDVEAYFKHTKDTTDLPMGFHGHDNLSLVMANTLKAIECGATMVDSSIQGMGRSAGNAITEVLVAILKQKGIIKNIDLNALIDIGQNIIQPLLTNKGMDPLAIISGYARFHSSFTSKVTAYAKKYNLDVRDLIVKLCEVDQVNAPEELLEKLGSEMAEEKIGTARSFNLNLKDTANAKKKTYAEQLEALLKEIKAKAIKYGKYGALNFVFGHDQDASVYVSDNLFASATHVIGSVTVSDQAAFKEIIALIDGKVDVLLLDINAPASFLESQSPIKYTIPRIQKSIVLTYSDSEVWSKAVSEQVLRLMNEDIIDKNVFITGDNDKSRRLANDLTLRQAKVFLISDETVTEKVPYTRYSRAEALENIDAIIPEVVICWEPFDELLAKTTAGSAAQPIIVDAAIGAISHFMIGDMIAKNIQLVRVNIWPVLSGWLTALHETYIAAKVHFGRSVLDQVPIVSGGAIGNKGDVIVDSINHPSKIIGIADGEGHVISNFNEEMKSKISTVQTAINKRLISSY